MIGFIEELWWLYAFVTAAAAWLLFAQHPTARNLRRALLDSIGL